MCLPVEADNKVLFSEEKTNLNLIKFLYLITNS